MMGSKRKRRSLEDLKAMTPRFVPHLRQDRGNTRHWMNTAPKMEREEDEASRVYGDEERRDKISLVRNVTTQSLKKLQERHKNRTSSREKRNVFWSFLFGDEEEEEEEEEEMEVVTSGERAIPSPSSPKSDMVDYLTFIKASLFPVHT
ncbi:hypothetical protein E2C01_098029 [Portunus trituberculatus]|uniref:Uncharacterized protein n=1 Tax=Portunus trituberculatus TaxID=210409 RepID=A0A5B7KCY1_PORTR|nr:hypothetical protein [Portunus trituberculatus]